MFKVLVNLRAITNGFYVKTCFYLNHFLLIEKCCYISYNIRIANFLTTYFQIDDFSILILIEL